jgi:hypothetical protein
MENIFLRGGLVKFFVLPDSLKSSPIFKKVQSMHAKKVDSAAKSGKKADGSRSKSVAKK